MTEKFKNAIQERVNKGETLFYNDKGRTEAFKSHVFHLSNAPSLGFGFRVSKNVHLYEPVWIVDFEKEIIEKSQEIVELIPREQ